MRVDVPSAVAGCSARLRLLLGMRYVRASDCTSVVGLVLRGTFPASHGRLVGVSGQAVDAPQGVGQPVRAGRPGPDRHSRPRSTNPDPVRRPARPASRGAHGGRTSPARTARHARARPRARAPPWRTPDPRRRPKRHARHRTADSTRRPRRTVLARGRFRRSLWGEVDDDLILTDPFVPPRQNATGGLFHYCLFGRSSRAPRKPEICRRCSATSVS